ncbi:unnamed protein product [Gemmata massiliana]|uniref:Uncharacterized protein n=1 Tax=Gemmata massiliana TaxID=1210884 RepID=A0A6P2CXU0_9BACT|nr:unnamed protein product [Gemmata massiliana]
MRYFTMAWWGGIQADDTVDPRPDYDKHLKTIRHRLSPNTSVSPVVGIAPE